MRERSYWDDCAEAMELTIEGNRLIVGEIAAAIRAEWRVAIQWLGRLFHTATGARHLPRM